MAGERDQNPVSGRMAEAVVDDLEIVQVHHGKTAGLDAPLNKRLVFAQLGKHMSAAGYAGQRIDGIERVVDILAKRGDFHAEILQGADEMLVLLMGYSLPGSQCA